MIRFTLVSVLSFAAGVLLRDAAQDWKDEGTRAALKEEIRQCNGRGWDMVLRANAAPMCTAMMPRFELAMPIPGDPLKLKRREIRKAIGGPYQGAKP